MNYGPNDAQQTSLMANAGAQNARGEENARMLAYYFQKMKSGDPGKDPADPYADLLNAMGSGIGSAADWLGRWHRLGRRRHRQRHRFGGWLAVHTLIKLNLEAA